MFENCEEKLGTLGNLHQPVNYDSISAKKSETLELVTSFCFTVIKIYK